MDNSKLFTATEIRTLFDLTYSQLYHLVLRKKIVVPFMYVNKRQFYTFDQVMEIKIIRELMQYGLSVDELLEAKKKLEIHNQDIKLATKNIFVINKQLFFIKVDDDLKEMIFALTGDDKQQNAIAFMVLSEMKNDLIKDCLKFNIDKCKFEDEIKV